MQFDRTYWRCAPTKRLIEEARADGDELAVALADRLEDMEAELTDARRDADRRDHQATIATLQAELAAAEDEIARLLAMTPGC